MDRSLYSDPYVDVTFVDADGMVRYVRTTHPFASLGDLRRVHEQIAMGIPQFPGYRLTLLLDVRDAPPRNDDEFEREIGRALDTFLRLFVAHATLVKSAAGLLQVRRLEKARGPAQRPVFEDEAAAVAYLKRARG
jgi:hypothetical protein